MLNPETTNNLPSVADDVTIKEAVRETYAKVAVDNSAGQSSGNPFSCCGATPETDIPYSEQLGYSKDEATSVPEGANMGLGCGNPTAIASLKPGEVVLDLGSGGGFDCFLAARQVGETGHVIGVDMTPEMISKARKNAAKSQYTNVEFRLGEIEALPVADASIDVIISNCVINLSTNKAQVFKEAARALKPGGRLAVSDIVATAVLPEHIKNDLALYSGCMAGASSIDELKQAMQAAGFEHINVNVREASRTFIKGWAAVDSGVENYVASASIEGVKPTLELKETVKQTLSTEPVNTPRVVSTLGRGMFERPSSTPSAVSTAVSADSAQTSTPAATCCKPGCC